MKTKAHALPETKTKQSPQRLLQGLPVGWELRGDSVKQPVSRSHARCCTTLEMLIPTTRTHEHADAQKEVTNNCAVSKLPAENKYPFARAFPKAQADLHSKSSSLKEHFLINRKAADGSDSQPDPPSQATEDTLVHCPNLCRIQAAFTCSFFGQ